MADLLEFFELQRKARTVEDLLKLPVPEASPIHIDYEQLNEDLNLGLCAKADFLKGMFNDDFTFRDHSLQALNPLSQNILGKMKQAGYELSAFKYRYQIELQCVVARDIRNIHTDSCPALDSIIIKGSKRTRTILSSICSTATLSNGSIVKAILAKFPDANADKYLRGVLTSIDVPVWKMPNFKEGSAEDFTQQCHSIAKDIMDFPPNYFEKPKDSHAVTITEVSVHALTYAESWSLRAINDLQPFENMVPRTRIVFDCRPL